LDDSEELLKIIERYAKTHPPEDNLFGVVTGGSMTLDLHLPSGVTFGNTTLTEEDVIEIKEIIDERKRS